MSVMIVNKKGDIVFVNQHFKNISSEKYPLFKNIFKTKFFISQDLNYGYKKVLEKGTIFKKEHCVSANKKNYINIVAVPLRNEKGKIDGALSMAMDVTEAVTAKLELEKLNSQLEEKVNQKTKQLTVANEKLKKNMEIRAKFISDASHEIRTPLAIAKLNLEFLKDQFLNIGGGDYLSAIDNEINKVSDIMSDISFFTAISEDTPVRMTVQKIELNEFLKSLADRVKLLAEAKNIDVIFEKIPPNFNITGDKTKLEKLFLNIISNSIKYGKKSGWTKITISQDLKNNSVKISIADNGIGISKKDLPRIFERFYRANSTKNGGEGGFGLGLAICKWIVEQHKGKIEVKSTLNKGSVFTITLPAD